MGYLTTRPSSAWGRSLRLKTYRTACLSVLLIMLSTLASFGISLEITNNLLYTNRNNWKGECSLQRLYTRVTERGSEFTSAGGHTLIKNNGQEGLLMDWCAVALNFSAWWRVGGTRVFGQSQHLRPHEWPCTFKYAPHVQCFIEKHVTVWWGWWTQMYRDMYVYAWYKAWIKLVTWVTTDQSPTTVLLELCSGAWSKLSEK